jgi:hypothetical protein
MISGQAYSSLRTCRKEERGAGLEDYCFFFEVKTIILAGIAAALLICSQALLLGRRTYY